MNPPAAKATDGQAAPDSEAREKNEEVTDTTQSEEVSDPKASEKTEKKGKKEKFKAQRFESKRFAKNKSMIDRNVSYPLPKALELLKSLQAGKFDETVEIHINVKEKGISGQAVLPHGTGKTLRIKVADDELIAQVEKGVIDFDVLVAHPQMMSKLAKIARVLGPRGLMPNPKNGTITQNPEEAIKNSKEDKSISKQNHNSR